MLRVWVHGCDPGRVSDDSRLALCQILSISALRLSFSGICILLFLFLSLCHFCFLFVCVFILLSLLLLLLLLFLTFSRWSFVDVPLIVFCPADHVPDWQPCILLGMVEVRSVNAKKTTTYI